MFQVGSEKILWLFRTESSLEREKERGERVKGRGREVRRGKGNNIVTVVEGRGARQGWAGGAPDHYMNLRESDSWLSQLSVPHGSCSCPGGAWLQLQRCSQLEPVHWPSSLWGHALPPSLVLFPENFEDLERELGWCWPFLTNGLVASLSLGSGSLTLLYKLASFQTPVIIVSSSTCTMHESLYLNK